MSEKTKAADAPQTDGVNASVTQAMPKLTVEVLPDVHCFIDGVEVKPGETAEVDGPSAVNLVMLGHAKIVETKTGKSK